MTRAALFDWDGTLVDTRAGLIAAWRAATETVLGRAYPSTPEEELFVATCNGREVLPLLTPDPAVQRALTETYQTVYAATIGQTVAPFPGIPEMLADLRAQGQQIGIVTAKARIRFEADVIRAGLAEYVDIAVCADDVSRHKPDPEGVHTALARLAVPPDRAAMIGDSPQDVVSGLSAGTTGIGVTWGFFPADALHGAGAHAVVGHPAELARLLTRPRSGTRRRWTSAGR